MTKARLEQSDERVESTTTTVPYGWLKISTNLALLAHFALRGNESWQMWSVEKSEWGAAQGLAEEVWMSVSEHSVLGWLEGVGGCLGLEGGNSEGRKWDQANLLGVECVQDGRDERGGQEGSGSGENARWGIRGIRGYERQQGGGR